jgi:hypothetical protein
MTVFTILGIVLVLLGAAITAASFAAMVESQGGNGGRKGAQHARSK